MAEPMTLPLPRPLPIALAPGLKVVSLDNQPTGKILGITQGYCIYSFGGSVCVDRWEDLALARVCPAASLLPMGVADNDHLNAEACVLRELSLLASFGDLTSTQAATLGELMQALCPSTETNID